MATEPRLPAGISRQVAQADAIQAMLDAANVPPPAGAPPAPDPFAQVLAAAPPPAPAAPVPPPAPKPPVAPVPPAPPAPAAPAAPDTLAEIRETQRLIRESMARQNPPAPPPPAPAAPAPAPIAAPEHTTTNDARDTEIFGADVLGMVDRKIEAFRQSLAPVFARIESRLMGVDTGVQTAVQQNMQTAEQLLVSYLDNTVPDWRTINVDRGFLVWLKQINPLFGRDNQFALDEAAAAKDGGRIAAVFKAYKSTVTPPPVVVETPNALESLVAPTTVAGAPPPPEAPATIFTETQVKSFYTDVRRGVYKGREADMNKIVNAIDEAAANNRIVRG